MKVLMSNLHQSALEWFYFIKMKFAGNVIHLTIRRVVDANYSTSHHSDNLMSLNFGFRNQFVKRSYRDSGI